MDVFGCTDLKFDPEVLTGSPLLKELLSIYNTFFVGNINSLRVLKDTNYFYRGFHNPPTEDEFKGLVETAG